MNQTKIIKTISNTAYSVGVFIVLCLGAISLFGLNEVMNSDAMLPFTYKDRAFFFLVLGTVPMLLACMAVYKFNAVKNSIRKKRNFVFIFLPGFICSAYAVFGIGVLILGMMNSFIFHGVFF